MKKLILISIFLFGAFLAATLKAQSVEAAVGHYGQFKNHGNVTVTVTFYIRDPNGELVVFDDNSTQKSVGPISPGQVPAWVFWSDQAFINDPVNKYTLTWWTHCVDPDVEFVNAWQANDITGVDYDGIEVGANSACGEPQITSISCPSPGTTLSFSWQMTGGGPYNVGSYWLFRSQFPDTNPDDNYIESYVTSASSASWSWGGMSPGATYYVRVTAVPPEYPNGDVSSPAYGQVTCANPSAPEQPTNLQVYNLPSCSDTLYGGNANNNGNPPNIKHTWSNPSGVLETRVQWFANGNSIYDKAGKIYDSFWGWNLSPNVNYTWRVKARNAGGWSDWVNGPSYNVPRCTSSPHVGNLSRSVPSCSDTLYSSTFSWTLTGTVTRTQFRLNGSVIGDWNSPVSGVSVSSLSPSTNYTWAVRAYNDVYGWSSWASGPSFYVGLCTPSPSPPNNLSQSVPACSDGPFTGTFSWSIPDPSLVDTVDFSLWGFVSTDSIYNTSWTSPQTTVTVNNIPPGKTEYNWQVKLSNIGGSSFATASFEMPACNPPDLMVTSLTTDKSVYAVGENIQVTVSIKNNGGSATPGTPNSLWTFIGRDTETDDVTTWSGCGYNGYNSTFYVGSGQDPSPFAAGATSTHNITIWASDLPTTPGNYTIRAIVDVYCWFDEIDAPAGSQGANNIMDVEIVIGTLPTCTLTILPQSVSVTEGDSVTFTWTSTGVGSNPGDTGEFGIIGGWPVDIGSLGWWNYSTSKVVNYTATFYVEFTNAAGTARCEQIVWVTPAPPTNLTAIASCNASNEPVITFSWDDSSAEDGYILDVNEQAWIDGANPSPWGYISLGKNVNTFEWSPSSVLSGGPPQLPAKNTAYWWRVIAYSIDPPLASEHSYPYSSGSSTTPPGDSVTTLDCQPGTDIKISVDPANPGYLQPDTNYEYAFNIENLGPNDASLIEVGFWPEDPGGSPPLADCTVPTVGSPVDSQTVTQLSAGSSIKVIFSFTTGSIPRTTSAYAYASYDCTVPDIDWSNNVISKSYSINVDAWFETQGGDVGSKGTISVSQNPPAGRYQSDYLLAGKTLDSSVSAGPSGWSIKDYGKPLIQGTPYDFLAERFREGAIAAGPDSCTISAGASGLRYCSGDATYSGGGAPSGSTVWFIDGNFSISSDLVVGNADTIVFVVAGDVIIDTSVTQADGIYIVGTGSQFRSSSAPVGDVDAGAQLTINGAVYTDSIVLNRTLGGALCPSGDACDNTKTPAEKIIFDPKYLIALNTLVGVPEISWQEAAP